MSTCCPNCSSAGVIGNDVVSACAECVSVSVAGGSMSMTALAGIAAGVIVIAYLGRSIRHLLVGRAILRKEMA